MQRCREQLAGYKRPKEIHFIALEAMPRSASGKVQRHELEKRLR
jgi:fatty-acyl-CoA synthase